MRFIVSCAGSIRRFTIWSIVMIMGNSESLEIRGLLHHIGITSNYSGFFYTAYAVELVLQDPERLLLVTKCIYPDVAKRFHTSWRCVERNIRTVTRIAWEKNRPFLEELAQHPLSSLPSAGTFLAILSVNCCKHKTDSDTQRHGFGIEYAEPSSTCIYGESLL